MTKLKCFGGSTSLTNFQNVKNDPMGPLNVEFYDVYPNMTHDFSIFQVIRNQQCYHEAIFNPKSGQKVPKIATFDYKINYAVQDQLFTQFCVQMIGYTFFTVTFNIPMEK